jgi:hypothetical protein
MLAASSPPARFTPEEMQPRNGESSNFPISSVETQGWVSATYTAHAMQPYVAYMSPMLLYWVADPMAGDLDLMCIQKVRYESSGCLLGMQSRPQQIPSSFGFACDAPPDIEVHVDRFACPLRTAPGTRVLRPLVSERHQCNPALDKDGNPQTCKHKSF